MTLDDLDTYFTRLEDKVLVRVAVRLNTKFAQLAAGEVAKLQDEATDFTRAGQPTAAASLTGCMAFGLEDGARSDDADVAVLLVKAPDEPPPPLSLLESSAPAPAGGPAARRPGRPRKADEL